MKKTNVRQKSGSFTNRIADQVGVNQRTVRRWRSYDDYPGDEVGFDSIVQWVKTKGLGIHKNGGAMTERRIEVEKEKLRKLRRENEGAENRVVQRDVGLESNSELAAKLGLLLKVKLLTELPALCVGQPIAEIRAIAQHKIDEISDVTIKGLLDWEPEGSN